MQRKEKVSTSEKVSASASYLESPAGRRSHLGTATLELLRGQGSGFFPHFFFPIFFFPGHRIPTPARSGDIAISRRGPGRVGRGSGTLLPPANPSGFACSGRAGAMGPTQGSSAAAPKRGGRTGMPESRIAPPCSVPPSQIKHPGPAPCRKGHCFLQGWQINPRGRERAARDGG